MDEESMLRIRLASDDRLAKHLEKKIELWLSSLTSESFASQQHNYEGLMCQVSGFQTTVDRQLLIKRANAIDIEKYATIIKEAEGTVKGVASQISSLKDQLGRAQKVRDNKLEYDQVARKILRLQTRHAYQESITDIKQDIEMLKREKLYKEKTFETRKRKFSELIDSVKDWQHSVEEECARGMAMRRKIMSMDQEYCSSDDEDSVSDYGSDKPTASGTSRRFQERKHKDDGEDEDKDDSPHTGDEDGIVRDEDDSATVVVNGTT